MLGLWVDAVGESLGALVELDVTNIAHGGVSVARHDGRVIFIADAIPGERVLARISEDSKKSFWRAETIAVVTSSAYRVEHVWSAAALDRDPRDRAGGAEFGHIALAHQRTLKAQVLADALARFAKVARETAVEPAPGDDERGGLGWRTRVRLQVSESGQPGPFATRSHRVIPVTDLPLAVPALATIAPLGENFVGMQHVDLVAPSLGAPRLMVGSQHPSTIREVVGPREFQLADAGFWQVHRAAPEVLTAAVQGAIDADRFDPAAANLDLYGGVGLLAAAVGDRFGSEIAMTTVESDPVATGFASNNLADWPKARAITGRVDEWLRETARRATSEDRQGLARATVILDPPRSGAGREVVQRLADFAPAQIVYVACDPVAFARDVGYFAERGYRLADLRAFDLFPHTHHLEAVGTLLRV